MVRDGCSIPTASSRMAILGQGSITLTTARMLQLSEGLNAEV